MSRREERLSSELRRLAADFLGTAAGSQSLITVTDCVLNKDGRRATILFSVLPDEREGAALGFVRRRRGEFVRFARSRLKNGRLPQIDFALDSGEKHRQKIDKLLQ